MTVILTSTLFIVCLIFTKYIIDTRSTIKELRFDRDKFRSMVWKNSINKDSGQKLNWLYKNIKDQLAKVIIDLEDTDFKTYDGDIKQDIVNALKNIDSYSTEIERQDMDSLISYGAKYGNAK